MSSLFYRPNDYIVMKVSPDNHRISKKHIMTPIRIIGRVDTSHQLTATVPAGVPAGEVEVVLIIPELQVDEPDHLWESGIAAEWHDDLADVRQDIYSLADGTPVDEAG